MANLRILNPNVEISVDMGSLDDEKHSQDAYFGSDNFHVVCALVDDRKTLARIDKACREGNSLFLCGHVYDMYGYMFVDFNRYQYIM